MRARFVVRLLDANGELLGWAEVFAVARDGGFDVCPKVIHAEREGVPFSVSIHWTDVNAARLWCFDRECVSPGQPISMPTFRWSIESGENVPLPPVTVRGSTIVVPTGASGAGV